MKLKLITFLLAATALGSACGDDDDGTGPEGEARVRIVHVAPEVPDIDLLLDGSVIEEDIPYLTATPYEDVGAGNRSVQVRPTGSTTAVIEGDVALTDGESHTLLVGGPATDLSVEVLEDNPDAPQGGFAKLRLIHGAPSAGTVDVYLTEPGVDLATTTPDFTAADPGDVFDYTEIEEGDYQLRVTQTGTLTPVIDASVSLGSGEILTGIAVETAGGGGPFDAVILDDTN